VVVVLDRNFSSRGMSFHTPGRSPSAVAEAGVVTDIVMVAEAVSVHRPDYLVADCIGWEVVAVVGLLY
jgi:hypothetical protein